MMSSIRMTKDMYGVPIHVEDTVNSMIVYNRFSELS